MYTAAIFILAASGELHMLTKFRVSMTFLLVVATSCSAAILFQKHAVAAHNAAARPQDSPNIPEITAQGCQKSSGKWNSSTQGIPGDGNPHNFSVHAPNGSADFLGGSARGFRQKLDNDYRFTCTINPVQPPTVDNSEQRRAHRLETTCRLSNVLQRVVLAGHFFASM